MADYQLVRGDLALVLRIIQKLVQLILVGLLLHRVQMAPCPLVHAIDAREHSLLDGVDHAGEVLLWVVRVGPAVRVQSVDVLQNGAVVATIVAPKHVVRVRDGEVERVRRRPLERDLQRHVQVVEERVRRTRERAGHGRVRDVPRADVELDDVVRPLARTLVLRPRGCLAVPRAVGCFLAPTAALEWRRGR